MSKTSATRISRTFVADSGRKTAPRGIVVPTMGSGSHLAIPFGHKAGFLTKTRSHGEKALAGWTPWDHTFGTGKRPPCHERQRSVLSLQSTAKFHVFWPERPAQISPGQSDAATAAKAPPRVHKVVASAQLYAAVEMNPKCCRKAPDHRLTGPLCQSKCGAVL